jgi:hypothetical protein
MDIGAISMTFHSRVIRILFVMLLTGFSYYLLGLYVNGDQIYYRQLYSTFEETNFFDIFSVSFGIIGSSEPLSVISLWLGAQLNIEKDLYISLYNFMLLNGLWLFCRRYKAGGLVLFLILTNYYILVLLTSAERLKFAFILITYGFVFFERRWAGRLLLVSSIGAHFQSALFLLCVGAYRALADKVIFSFRMRISGLFIALGSLFFVLLIYYNFLDVITRKINVYSGSGDIYDLVKPLALFCVGALSLKSFWSGVRVFVLMAPLFFIFGDERMTMVYFMVLFYLLGVEGRLKSPAFLVVLMYFSVQSIRFISNVFTFGTGFV